MLFSLAGFAESQLYVELSNLEPYRMVEGLLSGAECNAATGRIVGGTAWNVQI
jgi:hypothetical protein